MENIKGGSAPESEKGALEKALRECPDLYVQVTPFDNSEGKKPSDSREYMVEFVWPQPQATGYDEGLRKVRKAAQMVMDDLLPKVGVSWEVRMIVGRDKGNIIPTARAYVSQNAAQVAKLREALFSLRQGR